MTLLGFCKKVQFISTCQLLNASLFTYYVKYRLVLYDSSDCSSTVWVKAHLKLFIHNFMAKQCSVASFNLYCWFTTKQMKIIYFDIQLDFWLVKNNYQHLSKLYNLAIYVATPTFAETTFSYVLCIFVNKFNPNNIFVCFLINPSKIAWIIINKYFL